MGVVLPENGFLEGLRRLCNRFNMLLIFDEVISGFRAAKGGAQALYNVMPDLTCLGKIIGGGLPVGAYGGSSELMNYVSPVGPVYQAGTLSGNPLAMTAGVWALSNLSAGLYKHVKSLGSLLGKGLLDAAKSANVEMTVNVAGSVLTPFFSQKTVTNYASATEADTDKYSTFFHAMLQQGVYLPPSQFEGWFLSAAHTKQDVNQTILAARAALRKVT